MDPSDYNMKAGNKIVILDSTLRDGIQSPLVSLNRDDKVAVAMLLEGLGVDIIEAGFPASSQWEFDDVKAVADIVENCTLAVFARSQEGDIKRAAQAAENARYPRIHLSIATSPMHRKWKLGMSGDEIIRRACEAVMFARTFVPRVEIGAEDASRTEPGFLVDFCHAVVEAGADVVNITDTVGWAQPLEYAGLIRKLFHSVNAFSSGLANLSVHCHNDLGLATANTLAGIAGGAGQAEVTILGVGERAGNAALEEVVTALVKGSSGCYTSIRTGLLTETACMFSHISGVYSSPCKPVVGTHVNCHTSGIHQHGLLAHPSTYPQPPGMTGSDKNDFRFILSRHSGKNGFKTIIHELTGLLVESAELDDACRWMKENPDHHISSTALFLFLKEKKIIDSEIWTLERIVCPRRDTGVDKGTSVLIYLNNGEYRTVILSDGDTVSEAIVSGFNDFFSIDMRIMDMQFNLAGSMEKQRGCLIMHAVSGARDYHELVHGDDLNLMVAECCVHFVNRIKARRRADGSGVLLRQLYQVE